jgi:hypothetical protein
MLHHLDKVRADLRNKTRSASPMPPSSRSLSWCMNVVLPDPHRSRPKAAAVESRTRLCNFENDPHRPLPRDTADETPLSRTVSVPYSVVVAARAFVGNAIQFEVMHLKVIWRISNRK